MNIKRLLSRIHLWLGMVSGIIVFVLGITGCIYVFAEEIKSWVYADKLYVAPRDGPRLPLSQLLGKAQECYGTNKPVSAVEIYNGKDRSFRFRAFKESDGVPFWYWDEKDYYESVFVNPYTGEVLATENSEFEFFRIILWLHWSLLLASGPGQQIVGISTLIFVLSLGTGLILWWPKNKKAARQRYWFRWKDTTKWRRKNYDLHSILGFYALLFTLIIALTGLVWAFSWFNNGVQWLANAGKTYPQGSVVFSDTTGHSAESPIDRIYAQVGNKYPDAEAYYLYFARSTRGVVSVLIQHGTVYNQATEHYDQYTGTLLKSALFRDKNTGEKLRSMNLDIHTGAILGLPGKILAFFSSLIAASLPISGFLIWWGRRKQGKSVRTDVFANSH